MRRLLLVTGLAAIVSLGSAGVASASSGPQGVRVKPGSTWTMRNLEDGGCEVQTISAGGTWTADRNGDKGTYTASGKSLAETWTAGDDAGATVKTHWSKSHLEYQGSGSGGLGGGTKWKTTLVKGAVPGC
ncbi:MAG: hypothetical protein WAM97_10785 [Acidimicrobiales bacterium]